MSPYPTRKEYSLPLPTTPPAANNYGTNNVFGMVGAIVGSIGGAIAFVCGVVWAWRVLRRCKRRLPDGAMTARIPLGDAEVHCDPRMLVEWAATGQHMEFVRACEDMREAREERRRAWDLRQNADAAASSSSGPSDPQNSAAADAAADAAATSQPPESSAATPGPGDGHARRGPFFYGRTMRLARAILGPVIRVQNRFR
ncbi:hypothetical protein BJY01DRAFT_248396 [Aspergillus pseudoustus]|uniref:Transmembrane protein n=1 Tax=Aspergillus pseudoustus TaxID=1810923 RepID=A0ABR4JV88_9EURO